MQRSRLSIVGTGFSKGHHGTPTMIECRSISLQTSGGASQLRIVNLNARAVLTPGADLPQLVGGLLFWGPVRAVTRLNWIGTVLLNPERHTIQTRTVVRGRGAGVGVFLVERGMRTDRGKPT